MLKKSLLFVLLMALTTPWAVAQKALPYSYGFENNDLAGEGWTKINYYQNNTTISPYASHNGNYGYKFSYPKDNNSPQYLISPRLVMPANVSNIKVSLWYNTRGYGYTEKFKVGYSTTDNSPSSFTWDTEVSTATTTWQYYETSITIPVTTKYIAIAETNTDALYVDDIAFTCNIIGRSFIASDGAIPFITDYSYSFGLTLEGTTHTFTFSNPGTQSSSISVTHTGNFGVSLQNNNISAGGSTTLTVTMPATSGSDVITISSTNGIFGDFDINVSGTVRNESKLYQNGFSSLPTGWTTTGSWNYSAADGASPKYNPFSPSGDHCLITPRLYIAEGEKFFVEAKGTKSYSELKMKYSIDGSSWPDDATFATLNNIDQSNWNIYEFTGAPSGGYYIAIYSDYTNIRMYYGGRVFDKTFQEDGNWDDGWSGGAPTSSDYVCIDAACTIQNGTEAFANYIALSPNGSITIEDGGQLICNSAVQATVKKSVSHSGGAKDAANWYTIASPINTPTFDKVTNLIQDPAINYDLFRYNETTSTWENNQESSHTDFTTLENGRGYLYWNNTGAELSFAGEVNASNVVYHLTYGATNNNIKGFNLIGNPFTHNIYKGTGGAISDSRLATGFYVLNNASGWSAQLGYNTPIVPGQGILVQTTDAFDLTITNTNAASSADTRSSSNDLITFNVANDKYEDVAYVQFKDAINLNKIEHLNAEIPMLYVHQNDADYAIANMDREVASFDLNFVAATAGEYTISAKAEGQFEYFHLIDRIAGKDIDMLNEGKYTFTASPNDHEYRFVVRLSEEGNDNTNVEMGDDFAFITNGQLIVNGTGTLQIIDMTGRVVSTMRTEERISTNGMTPGVYVLRLIGNETKTQKIVIR